jgi:hypothetical protein
MSETLRNANKHSTVNVAMTTTSHHAIQMGRNDTSSVGFKRILVPMLLHKVGDPEEELRRVLGFTLIRRWFPSGSSYPWRRRLRPLQIGVNS